MITMEFLNKRTRFSIAILFIFSLAVASAYEAVDKIGTYGWEYDVTVYIDEKTDTTYTVYGIHSIQFTVLLWVEILLIYSIYEEEETKEL